MNPSKLRKVDWRQCVFKACITEKGQKDEKGDEIKLFCFPKENDSRIDTWIENSGKRKKKIIKYLFQCK